MSGLRYGKICLLADADSDGLHIATLLCALFVKHFRQMVAAGHLYIAMPPLYRIDVGKDAYYVLDEQEKDLKLQQFANKKVSIQRFKGLGEMNPSQLRETTMQSDSRRLLQLTIESATAVEQLFNKLLVKQNASERKTWLETKGNLAVI